MNIFCNVIFCGGSSSDSNIIHQHTRLVSGVWKCVSGAWQHATYSPKLAKHSVQKNFTNSCFGSPRCTVW